MNTIVINKVTLNKLLIVISVSLCMFLSISASKADAAAPVLVESSPGDGTSKSWTDMVVPSDGRPVFVTQTGFKRCADTSCSSVAATHNFTVGSGASVIIAPDGLPMIAYADSSNAIYVRDCTSADCSSGTTTNIIGTNGRWPTIAAPTSGNAVVAYNKSDTADAMLFACSNAACSSGSSSTLHSTNSVGWKIKVVVPSDNKPVAVFQDDTASSNGGIRLVKCGNAGCTSGNTTFIMHSWSTNTSHLIAMKKNSSGYPVIAFANRSSSPQYIYLINCPNADCTGYSEQAIDTSNQVYTTNFGIADGTDGLPVVAYGKGSTGTVVVKCSNFSCSSKTTSTLYSNVNSSQQEAVAVNSSNIPFVVFDHSSLSGVNIVKCDNTSCNPNTAPTFSVQPTATYGSYTRTGPINTPWTLNFTSTDAQQTGAGALTYTLKRSSDNATIGSTTGTFTSGASQNISVAYNAANLAAGSNTLYVTSSDGTLSTNSNTFTLLRDDVSPTAATTISTTPSTVSGNYTVTFTPNDAVSTGSNEMSYYIRTATGGGGTLLTSSVKTSTSGSPKTTASITTDTLVQGANTRYIRTCDGANNCTDTSFTVTASTPPSSVTTGAETNKSSYKVTFNGNANPNGSQAYGYFRLYTSAPDCTLNTGGQRFPSLESQDVSIGSGSAGVAFAYTTPTTVLLIASTDYWYCAYSRNVAAGSGVPGTPAAAGYDTFTTPDGPASGCDAPASGDMTISESCTFPQPDYDGVDNGGSGATNTGRITLASGGNITINPGQRIARGSLITNGGSFSIGNGSGSVIRGGVYLKDSDGDGIIDNPVVKVVANTQPAGYVRRNHLYTLPTYNNSSFNYASKMYNAVATSPSSLDCDQTSANAWRFIPSLVTDTDNDGYKTAPVAYQQCVGASSSINGRTYYSATASATLWQWLPDAQKLSATTDCQDDPAGVPCVPTSVSATNPSSQTQNNISWSMGGVGAAVPAATGYDIEWCSGSNSCTGTQGSGAVLTNVTSTYNHTGRTHTTWYGYGVLAKNAAGSSAYSGKSYAQTAVNCTTAYPDNDQDGYGNSGVITRGVLVKTASNSQTSITVTKPADVVNGQLMIAGIGYSGSIASNAITITAPAGWTLIENSNAAISEGMAIYRKVASGEPANYTWSFTATSGGAAHSVDANAWVVTYNNVNTSTPVNVSGKNTGNHGQTSSSANNTASSITTTVANTMVIGAMHSDRGNTTFDDVSGMNTFYNHSPGSSYDATISFDAVQPSAGATGIKSSLHTLGGGWAAVMVALTPLSTSSSCVALPSTGWSANQNDCEDNTTSYYQNTNGYPDIDADGVNPSSTTGMCSGASLRPGVSASSGADCNNTNTNLYQNLTGYIDMDGDLYSPSGSSQICSGAALPTGYVSSVSGTNDCYDGSANAKPGSTYYGITSRGDGSFDYNCDSSQTKQFPDNTLGDDSNGGYTHACPRSSIIAHGNWVEDHCEGSQAICGVAATSVQYVTQANISCGMIAAESSTFSTCWDTNCGSCPGGTMREVKAFAGFNAPNVCYYSFMGNNMYTGVCCR